MKYHFFRGALVVMLLARATAVTWAEQEADKLAASTAQPLLSPSERCEDRPWYCGVPAEQQQRALAIYKQANQLFDDALFLQAAGKYREALQHWDHPGIHYNLMLTLVALDDAVDAYLSSVAALRYGPAALAPEEHRRAEDYQKLLRGRIAELKVTCDEPDAVVSLDGRVLLRGPGQQSAFVVPGQHELVARKPGYLATHHPLVIAPAKSVSVHLRMLSKDDAWITTQRWAPWQPWLVAGAGVGLGLAGGLLEWRAQAENQAFQHLFAEACPPPEGCKRIAYTSAMESHHRRERWYRGIGHAAIAAGGAAVVSGLVLVYINRPYQVESPERDDLVRMSITPLVTPGVTGVSVQLPF